MPSGAASLITRPPVEIFGRYPGYGFAGLGVSTAIGNFTQTTFDLRFPGSLLGLLDWQRTYNSHSGAVGGLGPGWTTSFSASLVVTPAQGGLLHHTAAAVTFHDEHGRILPLTPDGSGGFTSPQDLLASLTQNADGSFALTCNSGEVWSFSSTGQLTGRSKEGQQVTLDYDSQGLLLRAAHSFGQSLTFSYDANRRLTSVAADDGRTVSFAYSAGTVTDSLLETVTVPGGGVFRYQFSGSGQASQVAQITGPDGDLVVANSYDPQTTRVTSQRFASDATVAFKYDDTSGVTTVTFSPSGAEATFQADSNGRLVKVTGPDQNTATFSFSASGYLTSAITPGGTQLTQTHDASGNLLASENGGATSSWTYDGENRVTSSTDPADATTQYAYTGSSHVPTSITDAIGAHTTRAVFNGLITSSTDADGNTTSFDYGPDGNLVSMTDAAGQVTSFGYDAAGNRTEVTTPSGATSQWTFNPQGQVTVYTNAIGGQMTFQYSPAGRLVARTDQTGATTHFGYDTSGNLTTVTDALGETFSYGYDADGNRTSITYPLNDVTQYGYDAFGRIISVTNQVGVVTTFGYDVNGNSTTQQGPAGNWSTNFDARGNPVAVTDPTGATTQYTYDLADRLTGITDPQGGTWQIEHDAAGMPAAVTDAVGATSKLTWTADGQVADAADPLGRKVTFTRDALGRVTAATDAGGGTAQFAYDPDGRRISVTTPAGLTGQTEYDAAGRVIATIDPRGWITQYAYNERGQKIAQTSPGGVTTLYRYDAAGRLTTVIDGDGNETGYGYDAAGRLISVTNAMGAVTRFAYDAAGHEISDTDPLGRTTLRAYDAAGNMVTFTDPAGHVQHLSYDGDHRLIGWTADDGTQVSYTYDKLGRRTSMTDATGTTHYTYDGAGNLLTVAEPDGSVFTAQYDKAGQRTSLTYPDGLQVTYSYNTKGQLNGLRDSRGGGAAYALDPDGRLITEELPGRLARRYHYEHGLLHRFAVWQDGVPVASTELAYDPDARVISQRDDGELREYRYDRLGQLISARHRERERDALYLTYDAVGNRTSLRQGDRHVHYRYDAASQLLAAEADGLRTEYRYDPSGRLTEQVTGDERRVIDYDGFGRPVKVTHARGPLTQQQAATFNGDGLTTMLVLTNTDDRREEQRAAAVHYQWSRDEIPEILTQRAEPELDDTEHEHPGRLDTDFTYGYGRVLASWERGVEAFHYDAFGSTVRTDETSDWAQAPSYDAFGAPEPRPLHQPEPRPHQPEPRPHQRPHDAAYPAELAEPELPRFGYRGELALGPMIDLRMRRYDADLGRFTTPDPLDSQASGPGNAANRYVYAGDDPLGRIDPMGLLAVPLPGDFVNVLQSAPRVVTPAAPRRASAQGTIQLDAETIAAGRTHNYTSLHDLAVNTARVALALQLGTRLSTYSWPTGIDVDNAGKNGAKDGEVDLAHISDGTALLWEAKSATTAGSEEASNDQAAGETLDYIMYWNIKAPAEYPDTTALPGPGLVGYVPLAGIWVDNPLIQWYVYSYNPALPEGALLYGPHYPTSGPVRDPVPVRQPATRRVPQQAPSRPWYAPLEFWHWHIPVPTIPIAAPIPISQQATAAAGAGAVVTAIIIVAVLAAG
jgi:RHS repeat-associated protein